MRKVLLIAVLAVQAGGAAAAPDQSVRPHLRPASLVEAPMRPVARPAPEVQVAGLVTPANARVLVAGTPPVRPVSRPAWASTPAIQPIGVAPTSDDLAANLPDPEPAVLVMGETVSVRPSARPRALVEKVMAKRRKAKKALQRGAICGDTALQGEVIGTVPGRLNGCGVPNAVKLKSVNGIKLSTPAIMDCKTAKAVKRWVDGGAKKAIGNYGGGLSRIKVAAHYACRTRNNQPGAKISEHGKGRAIDISALYTADGTELSVLKDWGKGREGRMLKKMHKAACGPFGTVLGPNADRFHRDHFHFDTARYRSGSYCR
ncbi:extensin family protein [Pseudaestuariivita atlantica]|uniref:Extensin-like C-terminal domain-containing protein n=1 Tax=Pseudaestuariivita atlantica TaxID=1317121 RepID=A0A0L1JQL6_9RHOB|nr:extensin family protein [Pseudaestuariivita atlantica]KNG94079.1 hypothetical protein ATO11_07480 [Pseudaestuariivita atlantica]